MDDKDLATAHCALRFAAADSTSVTLDADEARAILRALDRLRSAAPSDRDVWRPIETAPKDGAPVLGLHLSNRGRHYEIIWWDQGDWCGQASGFWSEKDAPTHWCPLPAPPKTTSSTGGENG